MHLVAEIINPYVAVVRLNSAIGNHVVVASEGAADAEEPGAASRAVLPEILWQPCHGFHISMKEECYFTIIFLLPMIYIPLGSPDAASEGLTPFLTGIPVTVYTSTVRLPS